MSKEITLGDKLARFFYDAINSDSKEIERQKLEDIRQMIMASSKFEKLISEQDVKDTLYSLLNENKKSNLTLIDVKQYINSKILTTKEYHFYFAIYQKGLPKRRVTGDYNIGYCKYIEFTQLPIPIQENMELEWKSELTKYAHLSKSRYELDKSIQARKNSIFLFLSIFANGNYKAKDLAMKQCEESMDLLRLDFTCDCTIRRYDVFIKTTSEYVYGGFADFIYPYEAKDEILYTEEEVEEVLEDYSAEIKDWFDSMSSIINEEWYGEKERRSWGRKLKNGIHLLALATCQNNKFIKLTLLCSALEAMLLNDSDKDAIASKLAERVAFVLCTELNARIEVYNNIKKLYNQRCKFVHVGDTQTASSEELEERCEFLEKVVRDTLMELEGYLYPRWDAVQKKEIYPSFEDFLNKVKFSGKMD